jgi:hypothetical protein
MADARFDATRNQYVAGNDPADDVAYTANGAIAHTPGVHAIAKAGSLAAMTLSAPTAAEEGTRIIIRARTAFAHTVTVAGGLGGNAGDDVITFAKVGDSIELLADALTWAPVSAPYGAVIS